MKARYFVLTALLAAGLTGCDLPWATPDPAPPAAPPLQTTPMPPSDAATPPAEAAAPTDPAAPAAPAPVEGAPAEPAPVEGAPTEPAPVEGTPAEPAPVEGAPAQPAPVEGAAQPAPAEGAPAEAAPAQPAPVAGTPAEPAPTAAAAPTEPAPAEAAPASSEPAPPAAKGLLLSPVAGVTLIQPDGWTKLDGNPAGSIVRLRRNEGLSGWQPTLTLSRLDQAEVTTTTDATALAASYAAALANRLDTPTAKVLGSEATTVAGRPAGLVRIDFESADQPVRALQWLVPTAGGVYLLTGVGGREGFAPEVEAELGSIVRSLTLPPG